MHKQSIAVFFGNSAWRSFAVGVLCGTVLTAAVGTAWVRWKSDTDAWGKSDPVVDDWIPVQSIRDANLYDACLVQKAGNTVACDALMRMVKRERAQRP